jgi:type IV secretion system protein VirB6
MGFFASFWSWLNGQLATYIGTNTARLASALEPAVVTLGTLYVMAWGYLQLTGQIEEPFIAGLKRVVTLAVVLGVGLNLWLYNSVIVDTFYSAPAQLASAVVGSADPVGTIDSIWESGGTVAGNLWANGTGSPFSNFGSLIMAAVVWCLIGLLCVYTMFLIALSNVALAVLLALGPLFVAMLFFDMTKHMFRAWVSQLANYALITVLTVMVNALLLQVARSYVSQTASLGNTIHSVDVLHMLLIAVLVFLILRQIMPIAAALAGGSPLSSLGLVSRTIGSARMLGRARKVPNPVVRVSLPRVVGALARTPEFAAEGAAAAASAARQAFDQRGTDIAALSRHWRQP